MGIRPYQKTSRATPPPIPYDLLDHKPRSDDKKTTSAVELEKACETLGIPLRILESFTGPRTASFVVQPIGGTKIGSIRRRQEDLTVMLGVKSAAVQVEDGALIITVNRSVPDCPSLSEILDSQEWEKWSMLIGLDTRGRIVDASLPELPSMAVGASTGAGKTISLHVMIQSLAALHGPHELSLVLIDPKGLEFDRYAGLPHLAAPVAVSHSETLAILESLVELMEDRYHEMRVRGSHQVDHRFVVVIDEWADIQTSPFGPDAESLLLRLGQKSRAAGIHIILATQRPEAKIVTGALKANFPARLGLATASGVDSKVVLDETGAEKLLGKGDALFRHGGSTTRLQVPMPTDADLQKLRQHYGA